MRLCRLLVDGCVAAGFYDERFLVPLSWAADLYRRRCGHVLHLPQSDDLLDYLPPNGSLHTAALALHDWLATQPREAVAGIAVDPARTKLLLPVTRVPKLLLLAGNYLDHIKEDGSQAEESKHTFPYVFSKPPSTTLLEPGGSMTLPSVSPDHMDWEVELACVIGATARQVSEAEALRCVAGYTILNDISDRRFRPNPQRKPRDWDKFFDWMHGKWHDGSAPCGPCIASAGAIADPQALDLSLQLNGVLRQQASTADQIFPVAAVISFLSRFVTLERGDVISTGTPAGVGATTATYLKAGDTLVASISGIGELVTRVRQ